MFFCSLQGNAGKYAVCFTFYAIALCLSKQPQPLAYRPIYHPPLPSFPALTPLPDTDIYVTLLQYEGQVKEFCGREAYGLMGKIAASWISEAAQAVEHFASAVPHPLCSDIGCHENIAYSVLHRISCD